MATESPPAPIEVALDPTVLAGIYDRLGHIEGQLPQFATKAELADLRAEMHRGFAALRGEFADLRGEFADLRAEFADLRAEMHTGFAEVRAEMHTGLAEMRADNERLRADFERQLRLMTWTLAGVVLAGLTALAAFLKLWG